ncbi:hypothetical protein BKA66DRAFT_459080 [Pyrenochaeta sp. MPI-SDFR-AT-0127]|nr:hypothetical protein BKA66DRAFT_459080 [Pyrenochaeta sp. MPI-SDFR-AT-0127]
MTCCWLGRANRNAPAGPLCKGICSTSSLNAILHRFQHRWRRLLPALPISERHERCKRQMTSELMSSVRWKLLFPQHIPAFAVK